MKIALIHDMLVQEGGQERVLRALQEVFPEAPTFVLFYNERQKEKYYTDKDIRPSFLQKMPGIQKKYHWYLPLMSAAAESHDLKDFDVILSSSSSFAKGVLSYPGSTHICYCHTPTRYLWSDSQSYVADSSLPPGIVKKILPFYLSHLRNWDWSAARRVDHFLANSHTVKNRIKRYYDKEAHVVYPPVDIDSFYVSPNLGNYYLTGGRLVPYKKIDLVVKAFTKLNMPLKIFGTGPEQEKLKAMAGSNIEFLGYVSDQQKAELYAKCLAFINPQEEDFGITTAQAAAAGRPAIAFRAGGALEIIQENETGKFFDDQTWENLANTVIHFNPHKFNPTHIRDYSQRFSKHRFKDEVKKFIDGIRHTNTSRNNNH